MSEQQVELLAIGAGPSNLALAVALEESAPEYLATKSLIIEQHESVVWQRGLLIPWAQSQVSFLKDLVTLRNPRSEFTFLNYLHSVGRLNQFVNLATFNPYRAEISDYLRWVAKSLNRIRIDYNRRCVTIQPVRSAAQKITAWRVGLADESAIICRNLVIGTGRDPCIPEVFAALPRARVIHSTEYSLRIGELDPGEPHNVVVIGGAQSAAEMLLATYETLPRARCTLVTRSIGLQSYEHSKFTNELYYPSFVDDFFDAPQHVRQQILDEMRRTNYGALDPVLLETLYHKLYLQRLYGHDRLRIVSMATVAEARADGPEVVLGLIDRKTGHSEELRCDVVMLGTGFSAATPKIVGEFAVAAGLREVRVNRVYRVITPPSVVAACYVQGSNEATHGIADSLLSVAALRAAEIVSDIVARGSPGDRAQAAARHAVLAQRSAVGAAGGAGLEPVTQSKLDAII